jgi:class 3 adenylate cyclase
MDVAEWLRHLGLEQYEPAFRENGIDDRVLPDLTAEDLKDLGVSLVGHRRQLLKAITALNTGAAPTGAPLAVSPISAPILDDRPLPPHPVADRRQLSVMFCDLVDSTPLSARLDPEDLGEVIRSYQARVAETIARFGGFIALYVGDGVLIYFGWPEAHEADAERAMRAALVVVAAVGETPVRGETLQVRIGIATGLVVVGEAIGSGEARQQAVVGETPNRAARLQGLAGPNGVVIDAVTRQQIGRLFECRDLGAVALKGLPESVHTWIVRECGGKPLRGPARQIEALRTFDRYRRCCMDTLRIPSFLSAISGC